MSKIENCPQCGEFHLDCECGGMADSPLYNVDPCPAKRVLPCHRIDLGGGIPLLVIGDSIEGETLEINIEGEMLEIKLGRPLEAKGE